MNTLYYQRNFHGPQRIGRLSYLARWGCFLVGSFVAGELIGAKSMILTLAGVVLLLFLFIGLFRWALIPRLHDIGVEPAWAWSLLFFVHGLSFLFLLALLLIPSDAFAARADTVWDRR